MLLGGRLVGCSARLADQGRSQYAHSIMGLPPTLDEWLKPECSSKKSMGKRPVPSAKRSNGVVYQAREGSDMASLPVAQSKRIDLSGWLVPS